MKNTNSPRWQVLAASRGRAGQWLLAVDDVPGRACGAAPGHGLS